MVVEEAVLAAHRTFIKLMEILSVPTDITRKLAIFQAAESWKMPDLESKCPSKWSSQDHPPRPSTTMALRPSMAATVMVAT